MTFDGNMQYSVGKITSMAIITFVMLVCMASYMMAGYGHANHAF
jgi:hypothetical protein